MKNSQMHKWQNFETNKVIKTLNKKIPETRYPEYLVREVEPIPNKSEKVRKRKPITIFVSPVTCKQSHVINPISHNNRPSHC